jgi:hypothetical protein
VLQGARSATIAESNGRANMFLAAVSGGLVALGLVATASRLGSAFYRTSLDRPERGRANPSPTGTPIRACAPCERTTGPPTPPHRAIGAFSISAAAGGGLVVLNQQQAPRRAGATT